MAQVDVSLTLSQLLNLCAEFNLPIDVNKKIRKWDLVMALREYTLGHVIDSKIAQEIFHSVSPIFNNMSSPQLSYPYELLDPVDKREVFNSADWVFEKKFDGYRATMTYVDEKSLFWSRTMDCATFFPVLFSNLRIRGLTSLRLPSFVLDGEIMPSGKPSPPFHNINDYLYSIFNCSPDLSRSYQKDNPVHFYPFDIIYYDGEWVNELPLYERAKLLESILARLELNSPQIKRVPRTLSNKGEFLDKLFRSGSEGVVAKNLNSPYNLSGLRKKTHFVKVKRSYFLNDEVMVIKDTMDGWISDVIKDDTGAITHIKVSTYVGENPYVFAEVPLPFSQRTSFIRFNENGIYYEPMLGTVVEVDGKGFDESGKLTSPILLKFRLDKSITDCSYDEESFHRLLTNKEVTT